MFRFQNHQNSSTIKMDCDATAAASSSSNDDSIDVLVVESNRGDSLERVSFDGIVVGELQNVDEVITGVELDLACASEKLVNVNGFMMHVATKEIDLSQKEKTTVDSVEKALEFTLLSGILDSEVVELDKLIALLQMEITAAQELLSSYTDLEEIFAVMEGKLQYLEQPFKQLQEQVSEIRMQSLKLQRTFSCSNGEENWNNGTGVSGKNVLMKMQTIEQQRHILRMLEKSLAREMDLEKKLTESEQTEEDLKLRLLSFQKLERNVKEAEDKLVIANSEVLTLREKVSSLEDKISEMGNIITDLEEKESKAEGRARNAEAKCKLLTERNTALNEELRHLKEQLTEPCGCSMPWQLSGLWKMS